MMQGTDEGVQGHKHRGRFMMFLPGMLRISRILKACKLTFSSRLYASNHFLRASPDA